MGLMNGCKEGKANDMIPMGVGEEKMNVVGAIVLTRNIVAMLSNAGTTIQNDKGAIGGRNLHTRCVAAKVILIRV